MEEKIRKKVIEHNNVGCGDGHKNCRNNWCRSKPFSTKNPEKRFHGILNNN
tara:strand:+ start:171 stop:323 length:153 start_codon:yes stop_codon:yes gene_type:complete